MDFVRKYLSQIKTQLTGLTLSQRLLIALLVVVMIGTIFFTVTLSAKPEMVVLIPQPMSSDEINRAEMALKGKHQYQVQGDRILVPAEKAYQIRGELFAAQALPKDTSQAFVKLMEDNDYIRSEAANDRRWNFARQETLAKILRGFPYLEDAQVIISKGERVGLGREAVPSSAMVTVKVRNNEQLAGAQVVAIVDMVRGAVAGMKREDVHVTDGMRPYHAPPSDTPMPMDLLAWKKGMEEDLTNKLFQLLGEYGNIKIAVNVVPDMSNKQTRRLEHGAKPIGADIKTSKQETSTTDGGSGGQPGVQSNTSTVTAGSGSKGSMSTSTTDTVERTVRFDETVTTQHYQPGTEVSDMTASIMLPRSYFVAVFRRDTKDAKAEPEDKQLEKIRTDCLTRVQGVAKNAIGLKMDEKIRVDWFDDTIIAHMDGANSPKGLIASSSFAAITQYAKQGVLGAVALGALMMMLMMVRKAVPAGAGADADPSVFFGGGGKRKGEAAQMDTGEDVFGEAGSGEAVLTGIELDDETLQSRKMVDEVSIMIKENPENAAALVKRWLAKGK